MQDSTSNPKAPYCHLILTRFNVKMGDPFTKGTDTAWLKHRFRFFEKICYPSVVGQSVQRFKWLLMLDAKTPLWAKDRVAALTDGMPHIIPGYIEGSFTHEKMLKLMQQHLLKGAEHLITTRLDNDDALCVDFVETIQKEFQGQELEFLNFPQGYFCRKKEAFLHEDPSNAFISLIERIKIGNPSSLKTVLCGQHGDLERIGPIRQVRSGPAWIQVVHGRNLANLIRGHRRPIAELRGRFSPVVLQSLSGNEGLWNWREAVEYRYRWIRTAMRWLRRKIAP